MNHGIPRLLDLFCGAGGATRGYQRAGFVVCGVDIVMQPRYVGEMFWPCDALEALASMGEHFDAIHASPPCQGYTTMSNRWRGTGGKADGWAKLIGATRELLEASGRPYVLENVPGARSEMHNPFTLTGGMFGLGVHRPRLFETNWPIMLPAPAPPPENAVGVYGKHHDGRRLFTRSDGSEQRAAASLDEASEAMGAGWMEWRELCESIPPAYTEFIGDQLFSFLATGEDVAA